MRSDPEVFNNIVPAKLEVIPQVNIHFEPKYYHNWALELEVSKLGIKISPLGKRGNVWNALDFVIQHKDNQQFLASLACELVVLSCRNAYWRTDRRSSYVRTKPKEVLDTIFLRLEGEDTVPLTFSEFRGKPGNSMKNMLIKKVISSEVDDME